MTDMNSVEIIGNLTRDLMSDERNFGFGNNGQAHANISIAVNRSRKQGDSWVDDVNYFDVTIWGKTAENLKPYLVKGQKIAVKGYLKQDRWERDGQKNSRVIIIAEGAWLIGGKNGNSNKTGNNQQNSNYSAYGGEDPNDIPFN